VEFRTLASKLLSGTPPFGRLILKSVNKCQNVLENGGFPVNFDRCKEWETESEIFLTRALVLLAFWQSLYLPMPRSRNEAFKLSPEGQQFLVAKWLPHLAMDCEDFGVRRFDFRALKWWAANSGGRLVV
jgi:hypothetical protein